MNRRRLLFVALFVALSLALVWNVIHSRTRKAQSLPGASQRGPHSLSLGGGTNLRTLGAYPQISLRSQSREDAIRGWLDRKQRDPKADWKVSIDFFGKVLDENSKPVQGATVLFRWTDQSAEGSSTTTTVSDSNGIFSLRGVAGKRLNVQVKKPGYVVAAAVPLRSFEFSNPAEDNYYEPNSAVPVIFPLHSTGKDAILIKRSVEVSLPGDGTAKEIVLDGGTSSTRGKIQIQAWKPWPPRGLQPHYDWRVLVTSEDVAFTSTTEEFPVRAPEGQYSKSFEIAMPSTAGANWRVAADEILYFQLGMPTRYGRLHLRTDGSSRYVFIDYVLNPSGGRDLTTAQ